MKNYTALMVDIEKSRKYERKERQALQERLLRCLAFLNRLFAPSLSIPVGFSAGDEFQGLFHSPAAAYRYFRVLETLNVPVALRMGIGVGDWTLRMEGGPSTEQDGTAYHRARRAIELAEEAGGKAALLTGTSTDVFTNEFLIREHEMRIALTRKQKQLLVFSEAMVPVLLRHEMDPSVFPDIDGLIKDHPMYQSKEDNFDFDKVSIVEWITDDPAGAQGVLRRFRTLRGLPGRLAEVTGETRQNIANVMRAGHLTGIRDLEMVILRWLERLREEGKQ